MNYRWLPLAVRTLWESLLSLKLHCRHHPLNQSLLRPWSVYALLTSFFLKQLQHWGLQMALISHRLFTSLSPLLSMAVFSLNLFLCIGFGFCVLFYFVSFCFGFPSYCGFVVFSKRSGGPSGMAVFGGASSKGKLCSLHQLSCSWYSRLVTNHFQNYR